MRNDVVIWFASSAAAVSAALVVWRLALHLQMRLHKEASALEAGQSLRTHLVRRLGAAASRALPPRYHSWLSAALVQSGRAPEENEKLVGFQTAGGAAGATIGLLVLAAGMGPLPFLVLVGLGVAVPVLRLVEGRTKRHRLILRAFPFHLDLLALGVESGLDLPAVLERVAERSSKGPLHEEFSIVLRQMRMGKSRREALEELSARLASQPIDRFCRTVIQADRMGTPLGSALKTLANELRSERFLRAEKLAAEAPVKMLFPLLFFIFPCIFLVLFGPIVFALLG